MIMLDEVRRCAADFDVLHFHIDILHFPLILDFAARTVTTLHGRLDIPDLRPFYVAFPEFPMVSISDAQRQPMPPVNWIGTVRHGLPRNLLAFNPTPTADYLAFLGRISPEKRRSEEHTSELQSLMRNSYAVFCLQKKKKHKKT